MEWLETVSVISAKVITWWVTNEKRNTNEDDVVNGNGYPPFLRIISPKINNNDKYLFRHGA